VNWMRRKVQPSERGRLPLECRLADPRHILRIRNVPLAEDCCRQGRSTSPLTNDDLLNCILLILSALSLDHCHLPHGLIRTVLQFRYLLLQSSMRNCYGTIHVGVVINSPAGQYMCRSSARRHEEGHPLCQGRRINSSTSGVPYK